MDLKEVEFHRGLCKMHPRAKRPWITGFQFPGPKDKRHRGRHRLARKATGRHNVLVHQWLSWLFPWCLGFDGEIGIIAVVRWRNWNNVSRFPHDKYVSRHRRTVRCSKPCWTIRPATGQTCGNHPRNDPGVKGLNTTSAQWAQTIQRLARRHGALLIVDDIQVGWPTYCAWWIEEGHQPNWPGSLSPARASG